jgi:hypothetical protein
MHSISGSDISAYFSFFEKTLPIIPEINPPIPLPSLDSFYGAAAISYFFKVKSLDFASGVYLPLLNLSSPPPIELTEKSNALDTL